MGASLGFSATVEEYHVGLVLTVLDNRRISMVCFGMGISKPGAQKKPLSQRAGLHWTHLKGGWP